MRKRQLERRHKSEEERQGPTQKQRKIDEDGR